MNRYTYRAKRIDNNEWIFGVPYYSEGLWWMLVDDSHSTTETGTGSNNINIETLCQCTGLQDRDGKDIFENDMLDGIYEDLYVSYCDKCKQLQLKYICNDECLACEGDIHWFEFIEDCNEYKIIGNKFDKEED